MLVACNGTTSQPSPPPPTPTPAPTHTTPPTFVYVEAGDELAFWAPTSLRLVRRDGRTCTSELSTGADNMWTGPDVEAAIGAADVRQVIARGGTTSYVPAIDDAGTITEGTLRIGGATIEWRLRPCRWCVAEPDGVAHLHRLLIGVMNNRRLLCDTPAR